MESRPEGAAKAIVVRCRSPKRSPRQGCTKRVDQISCRRRCGLLPWTPPGSPRTALDRKGFRGRSGKPQRPTCLSPTAKGLDAGHDVTGSAAIGSCWAELLLLQVLGHTIGPVAWVPARPEPASGLSHERCTAHKPGDAVATQLEARGPELLMDAWCAVKAAAANDAQLHAQPGHRKTVQHKADQAKPLGGSCFLHLRGVAEWAGGRSALPPA